jgi:hypothetical protein
MKTFDKLIASNRGTIDPVDGIVLFAVVAVIIYMIFPILAGVASVTTGILPVPNANTSTVGASALYNQSVTAGATIASGTSLISLEALVIAAVVILATVMLIRHKG